MSTKNGTQQEVHDHKLMLPKKWYMGTKNGTQQEVHDHKLNTLTHTLAQLAGAAEYTNCISAER